MQPKAYPEAADRQNLLPDIPNRSALKYPTNSSQTKSVILEFQPETYRLNQAALLFPTTSARQIGSYFYPLDRCTRTKRYRHRPILSTASGSILAFLDSSCWN